MAVVVVMVLLLVAIAAVPVRFAYQRHKLFARSWHELLSCTEQVNFIALRKIADCYLIPSENQLDIDPAQMWAMVGGISGIHRLRHNIEIMLQLAIYAERWNVADSRVVAAIMRRDAAGFRKAALRMELAVLYPYGIVAANLSLQEAIAAYCLMRERLVGLYQVAHVGRVSLIQAAL